MPRLYSYFSPNKHHTKGNMYKAVFIDMDGTLLRKDHTVSSVTAQTIKKLISQGILVVPISARPLHGMLHITNEIFPDDTPIVSLNGGYIVHYQSVIQQIDLSVNDAISIHENVLHDDVSVMYYSQMNWFTSATSELVKKEQRITPVPITIQPFANTISLWQEQQTGPNKILIAGDATKILAIEANLLQLHGDRLNIYKSQPRYLEIMHPAASKAKAILFLMDKYGLQQQEIIAIGDNYNDKGMIEFAGLGIAMGNAPDEIKAVADYITDTNNNDGVAKALQHFFNN